ncbi:hypothetical protein [Streptomyces phaeochromogenes]
MAEQDAAAHSVDGGRTGRPVLADLYQRWALDIIPGLGSACAVLCRDNPQEFKNMPPDALDVLANLRYRTGFDSTYLDDQGRRALISPVLGDSDGTKARERTGAFHRSADALRGRAKDFVQRVATTGEAQLRLAFQDSATTFQKYLTTVDGNVVHDAYDRYATHFDDVVAILRTTEFAAGLGLPPAPSHWPLDTSWDGDGAMLVHAVSRRSQASGGRPVVSDEEFLQLQRLAAYGAEAITAVLTNTKIYSDVKETDAAIGSAYRWWTAIAEYTGTLGVPAR